MSNSNELKSRPHYQILDGLRGVAAIAIVLFHFMEWIFTDFSKNFIGHGFLAVDFFFCLSGFVVGYAYDSRLEKMGLKRFFTLRLIRLHPMVIFGSVIGLIAFLFDPFATYQYSYDAGKLLLIFVCSLLLIPFPVMEERGFNLYGLNAPAWSLFWEYVANIVYALFLVKINRRYLFFLLVPAACFLLYVANERGNLLGGWNGDNFWDGGVRIWYSFTAGLIIYRYNLIIKNRFGFFGLAVLLVLAFVMPHFSFNWLMEFLVVLIYFPFIVSLGAGSALSDNSIPICRFAGDISYPLYMTHYAAIWIFGNYLATYEPVGWPLAILVAGGTVILITFGWIVTKWYDVPVRKWLNRRSWRRP